MNFDRSIIKFAYFLINFFKFANSNLMIPSSYIRHTYQSQNFSIVYLNVKIFKAEILDVELIDTFVRLTIGEKRV